jgi:lipid-A-disaccharide synthase
MIEAAAILARSDSQLEFQLPIAEPMRGNEYVRDVLSPHGPFSGALAALSARLQAVELPAYEVLRRSQAALIASGTATLEAGVVGVPMVVAYKVSPTTAFVFRNFVRYKGAVAMVNLIHGGLGSGERAVPELLQDDVTPEKLASALREVLSEPRWSATRDRLARTRALLQGPGLPIENAARAVRDFVHAAAERKGRA